MKKTYSLILLLIVILIFFSGYKLLSKEKESNQNKQTIENETSSLETYDNPEVGFSFQYPSEMIFLNEGQYNKDPEKTYLRVDLKRIGEQEKPMDLDKEEEMNNILFYLTPLSNRVLASSLDSTGRLVDMCDLG